MAGRPAKPKMEQTEPKKEEVVTDEIMPNVTNIKSRETYTLPSKGLVYDETDNIPASITLRRMTTREDKIRLRNETDDEIKRDILQACIMEDGINAGKLKVVDANFLLFRLRSLSLLTDEYKVTCRCPSCRTEFVDKLNLMKIPIEYMSEEKIKRFKVELPISHQKIDFKYPNLDEFIRMTKSLRAWYQQFPNGDVQSEAYTALQVLYIDKINGTKPMLEELENWLDNLDILDSRAVKNITDGMGDMYGFNENIKAKCPKCGLEITHGLPITSELFTPSN